MKSKKIKISVLVLATVIFSCMIGLIITGWQIGWGPFTFLHSFDNEVNTISEKYNADENQGNIIFYGASNFRMWTDMETDMQPYRVQNHGFGGSTDEDLVKYADKLLYPYNPKIVFFQTGSNDYVNLKGSNEEKINICMEYKKQMFAEFHEKMPDTKFVVMSGLLLPGRSRYTDLTIEINKQIEELCENSDYMYFVDASDMTFDGNTYREDLFIKDKIHLNHNGQREWCNNYIMPTLKTINNDTSEVN